MKTAELITIGDELLRGEIRDENSRWICEQFTRLGVKVDSITAVGDDLDKISKALSAALSSEPDYIVISGGLGATPDDVTVEAIAKTIGEGVELDQRVLKWIEEKLGHLVNLRIAKRGMTPDIEKIAMIPKGMVPIYNRIGLAPGLVGKVGKSTLIILPGVPAELKNLFEEISEKYVKAEEVIRSEELKVVALESDLIPYFKRILEENPDVKVGSYPIVTEKERFLLVKFYLRGKDPEFVKGVLKKVKDNFINSLLSEGFPILEF